MTRYLKLPLSFKTLSFSVVGKKMTKKKLKIGSIPTLNMPTKSHTHDQKPRQLGKYQTLEKKSTPVQSACYQNLRDLSNRISSLKCLSEWKQSYLETEVVITKKDTDLIDYTKAADFD